MSGAYGVRDVCLSVPTEVGCGGVRKLHELPLTPKERLGIQNSARVLRDTIDAVEKRLAVGPVSSSPAATPAATPAASSKVATVQGAATNGRAIPRAAWNGK